MKSDFQADPGVRLMMAYQGGDEAAFDELVQRYSGQVFALLTRFLGRRSDREDFVQEVFLRVVRARERYTPTARFSTWLYRIVFNLSVNETERKAGKGQVTMSSLVKDQEEGGGVDFEDEDAELPSDNLERLDVVQAVQAAIAALPEAQRMALVLAKYEELPYDEIGRVVGSSEKAVKSMVHRARENLRASLAAFMEEEQAS
ncbi:MAG: sigma-70 family RNA polymerase sigma factor [Planctomycetota bacterium]|nr:sigma-70 family RNA polymerase sigma factor [Planctomycetota bacterium]MDP6519311.1 sigma-70 family RNA polymerase sigma factor [Planctomycetota bacterium]